MFLAALKYIYLHCSSNPLVIGREYSYRLLLGDWLYLVYACFSYYSSIVLGHMPKSQ